MSKIINFANVSFSYNEEVTVLSNISLSIPKGKIIAIMGGSGCGKTTLLKLISGQLTTTNGTVTVFNKNMDKINGKDLLILRKRIGMLFQFGALFTDMSVYENVAFSLNEHTNLPTNIIKKIVAMKLNAVGLFGTQQLSTGELSGGMARRVALARAMALDPELMLYDEPFTGLDPISLNVTAMLIKRLNDALGQTSILVTHDIDATLKIADYIYFMESGKIIGEGSPQDVLKTENPAIKQFINGQIDGPFSYQYNSSISYLEYIGA